MYKETKIDSLITVDILRLVLLSSQTSGSVHDLDAKLIGSFDNDGTLTCIDAVGNNGGELLVMHKKHFKIRWSLDQERIQAVLQLVSSLLAGPITNFRHKNRTLELSSDPIINTTGLSPAWLQNKVK